MLKALVPVDGSATFERVRPDRRSRAVVVAGSLALFAPVARAAEAAGGALPEIFGIPVDFILFALTLLGVALFHHHTLKVALIGLSTIILYKNFVTGFKAGAGLLRPGTCTCCTSG